MPQGKLKVKTKLPKIAKKKTTSGLPATSRKNKPVQAKYDPLNKIQKLNKKISKNVNRALEVEIRQIANNEPKVFLSKKKNALNSNTKKK